MCWRIPLPAGKQHAVRMSVSDRAVEPVSAGMEGGSLKIAPSLAFVIARCDAAPTVRTRDSLSRCAARTTWPHYVAIVVTCLVCAELRTLPSLAARHCDDLADQVPKAGLIHKEKSQGEGGVWIHTTGVVSLTVPILWFGKRDYIAQSKIDSYQRQLLFYPS